jgi:hypothetical protein
MLYLRPDQRRVPRREASISRPPFAGGARVNSFWPMKPEAAATAPEPSAVQLVSYLSTGRRKQRSPDSSWASCLPQRGNLMDLGPSGLVR